MTAHMTQPNPTGRGSANALNMPLGTIAEAIGYAGATPSRALRPNEVYLDIRGSREVHVEGILDFNGILDLEEKIKALKMILKKPEEGARKVPLTDEELLGGPEEGNQDPA